MYLFDTNIAIHLRDNDSPAVSRRYAALGSPLRISLLSWIELEGGIGAAPNLADRRRIATDGLLQRCTVVPLEDNTVRVYTSIITALGFSRPRIVDRLIAATAIVNDLTLITINGSDFRDIAGLKLEVWPTPVQ